MGLLGCGGSGRTGWHLQKGDTKLIKWLNSLISATKEELKVAIAKFYDKVSEIAILILDITGLRKRLKAAESSLEEATDWLEMVIGRFDICSWMELGRISQA